MYTELSLIHGRDDSMIIVLAKATVKDGAQEKYVETTANCVAETNKEPGCFSYRLVHDCADKRVFTFVEQWKSKADLDAHMRTAHFKALGPAIESLTEGPLDVQIFEASKL